MGPARAEPAHSADQRTAAASRAAPGWAELSLMHLSDVTPVETENPATAGFPLRAWIALVAMILIIALAGYVMYDRIVGTGSDVRGLVEIGGARRAVVDFGAPRIIPDGMRISGNMHQVKAGDARLTITKRTDGTWNYNFSYDKPD